MSDQIRPVYVLDVHIKVEFDVNQHFVLGNNQTVFASVTFRRVAKRFPCGERSD